MDYWIWCLILILITYIVIKARKTKTFFQQWGIPQPSELPFIGIMGANIFTGRHVNDLMKDIYSLDRQAKYIGCHMFVNPLIVVRDLDLIKSVLVKNFDHFADHKVYVDEEIDPLFGKNLAFLNGDRWRDVRNLLSPAFTSSKLRTMFGLMSDCAENFTNRFLKQYHGAEEIDMKDVFSRYANDVIATCAFGIEVDSLKYPKNDFYVAGKKSTSFGILMLIKVTLISALPQLSKLLGLRFISKKHTDFFLNLIGNTIKTRDETHISRPDMLQLMMDARSKTSNLDIVEITAQAYVFFLGGFDTTSNVICMIAHELSINSDVQEKLQDEIDALMTECNGKPTYEAVNNLHYLDAVINETLRIHPIGFINRICSKDFEFPPALPGSKAYIVKKGTEIMIPVAGIHVDPEFYEDPGIFNPNRFLNQKMTASNVTSLGFGMGPRMCIGTRFAILEIKILLVQLLHKCSLVICKKTSLSMKYDKASIQPHPKEGFWLRIKPRN